VKEGNTNRGIWSENADGPEARGKGLKNVFAPGSAGRKKKPGEEGEKK